MTTKKGVLLAPIAIFIISLMIFSSFPVAAVSRIVAPTLDVKTPTSGLKASFASSGTNTMSPNNLLPGDIILLGTDDTFFDYLIPGKWSHTVIFGGIAGYHEIWATEEGTWVPAGEAWVVHSTKDSIDSGLRTSRFITVVNHHAGNVVAMRVLKPGGVLMTASERQAIVDFAVSKIGLDEGYDWNWLGKQVGIDTADPEIAPDGYYCSELAWAAYKSVLGIDLDGDFSPFNIGVSPEDLYWSQYAQVIALEMNSDPNGNPVPGGAYAVDASNDLYKLTVFIDEVYYDDEHEGWLMGDGEMYLKLWIGEAYFPSRCS
ncbi:MAG: YiiX/YebB-like N1pC/P60 family cysteine hydrolase [Promethearchaeota archaeon]